LIRAGPVAIPALRRGLQAGNSATRLRCARLLALRGDAGGEQALLETLHKHGDDPQDTSASMAEVYLLSLWEQREGPDAPLRAHLAALAGDAPDAENLAALNEAVTRYPLWLAAYVRRARLYLRTGETIEARHDALFALTLDPENFEAMTLLSEVNLTLNDLEDAYTCMQQAVHTNPRLRRVFKEKIEELIKLRQDDRERRRRDRRKERPVV